MKRLLTLFCMVLVTLVITNAPGFSQNTLLVADGTAINEQVPINGDFNDIPQQQQLIYPGSMLTDMVGGTISSMTWYLRNLPSNAWDAVYSIRMGSCDVASFQSEALLPTANTVEVYSGTVTIDVSTRQLTINFTTPYTYTGGNLMVHIQNTVLGNVYAYAEFYGIDRTNSSIYTYDWNGIVGPTRAHFLPKTQFTYTGGSNCLSPTDLSIVEADATSATITWHSRTANAQYQVYCGPAGGEVSSTDWILTTDTVFTFQNLTPNSLQTAYVRSYCGTDVSGEISLSFYTGCNDVIDSFPWSEDFEGNWKLSHFFGQQNNTPSCWKVYNGGTTAHSNGSGNFYWQASQLPSHVHSGQQSAVCYTEYAQGSHNDWLISPMLNLTGEQKVSFYVQNNVYNTTMRDEISVWISDENPVLQAPVNNMAALSGFTMLFQTGIPIGEFSQYEVSLEGYSGNRYIAFVRRNTPNSGWYLCLDDVTVENIPSCATPTELSVVPFADEAYLSWVADVDTVNLYYKPSYSSFYAVYTNVTLNEDSVFVLPYLDFGTVYDWYVEAICSDQSLMQSEVSTFNTTCGSITYVPISWNFERNIIGGTAAYPLPACWSRAGSSMFPHVYNNQYVAYSGNACLYSGSNAAGIMAVLPAIEIQTLPINTLQIGFFAKTDGNMNANLEVGIMSDPSDVTSFVPVQTISTLTDNYTEYRLSFASVSPTDTSKYIAIRMNPTDGIYIDDIKLERIPECDMPTNVQISNVTSHSVKINWSSMLNNHRVYYQESGSHGGYVMVHDSLINGSSYVLDSLTPNTTYSVYVSTICLNGSEVASSAISFTTECIAIDSIPYTWDFESNNTTGTSYPMQICWNRMGSSISSLYVSGVETMAHSGSHSMYAVNPNNYILVLPVIDTHALALNTLQLSLYAKSNYGRSSVLEVGVITEASDPSSFESVLTINLTQNYRKYEIPFTQYNGSASHFAFRMRSGTDYVVIDDVTLELAPSCPKPGNLDCVSMNTTSVKLAWETGGHENTWTVVYGPQGFNPDSAQNRVETSNNVLVIDSLSGEIAYDFYVRANCEGGEYSGWLGLYNITLGHYNMRIQGVDSIRTCEATIYDNGGVDGNYAGGCDSYMIVFPSDENSFVEISGTMLIENSLFDYLVVYDGVGTEHEMYRSTQESSDVQTIPVITSHTGPLTIYFHSDNSVEYEGFVINTTCVSCVAPRMTVNTVGTDSVVLFIEHSNTGNDIFELVYGPLGFDPDSAITIGLNNVSSYTITGLTSNISYEVYIRKYCVEDSSYSAWSHGIRIATLPFMPATLPYSCNFENGVENAKWILENGSHINRWYINAAINNTVNGDSALYISDDNGVSNSYQITNATSRVWAYRDFQIPEGEEFLLSFDWRCYGEGNSFSMYDYLSVYMGQPIQVDAEEEDELEELVLLGRLYGQLTWTNANFVLGSEYANKTKRLYFLWKNDDRDGMNPPIAIDNISLKKINCAKPIDHLSITGITDSSATITITPTDVNAIEWQLRCDNEIITVIGDTSYLMNHLNPASQYVVYARSICNNEDTSLWTSPNTFMTNCHSITASSLPYSCNFDFNNIGGTVDFPLPVCWQRPDNVNAAPLVYYTSGTINLGLQSGPDPINSIVMLPQIDTTGVHVRDLMLSFDALMECLGEYTYCMEIGVMSDPNEPLTFVPVDTINGLSFDYSAFEVSLGTYTGTGTYIAFRFNATGGIDMNGHYSYAAIFVDDLVLDYTPDCRKPNDLVNMGTTDTSVRITWNPIGNENEWEIKIGPFNFNPNQAGSSYVAHSNELVINNLQTLTAYDIYVRAHCGENLYSAWCGPLTIMPGSYNMRISGIDTLYTCNTMIYDNGGPFINYSDWCDAYLVLYPDEPNRVMEVSGTISGDRFYDYLVIYDGAGIGENLGEELYNSFWEEENVIQIPSITSLSGPLTIYFHSDYEENYAGFELAVSCISCVSPSASVSSVYLDSAVVSWTNPIQSANDFELVYGLSGFNPDLAVPVHVTGRTYPLMGLAVNTSYDVYVRTVCGNDHSEWSSVSSFSTLPGLPASVPYICDFENATENSQWKIVNGNQTNKWYIQTLGSESTVLYVSKDGGVTNEYNNAASSDVWAYRDIQFPNNAEFMFSFDWKCNGEEYFDYVQVFIGDPVTVTAGSDELPSNVVSLGRFNMQTSWTRSEISISQEYAGQLKRLYFLWHNDFNGGYNNAAAIDNISIEELDCVHPAGVNVTNITPNSAHVSITQVGDNVVGWQLKYDNNIVTIMNDTTFDLVNLLPAREYNIEVRSICTLGDTSVWFSAAPFSTACGALQPSSIPYICSFENNNTQVSEFHLFPTCWQRIGTNDNPFVEFNTYGAHQGEHYLTSGSDADNFFVILPEINKDSLPINELQLRFYAKLTDYTGSIDVGVMTDPTNTMTFAPLTTISNLTNNYVEYEIPLSQYNGNGSYIALRLNSEGDIVYGFYQSALIFIDDLTLEYIPDCPQPDALSQNNISAHSADLSWSNVANLYRVYYREVGVTNYTLIDSVSLTNGVYTLTNLSPLTTYEWYVASICANGSVVPSHTVGNFTTLCEVVNSYPYQESFEYGLGCWISSVMVGGQDEHWQTQNSYGVYGDEINPADGNSFAESFCFGSGNVLRLSSPAFDLTSLQEPYIKFYHVQLQWGSDQDYLKIYYKTSGAAEPVLLVSYTNNIYPWRLDSLALPNPSSNYQLLFDAHMNYGYGVGVDNIIIYDNHQGGEEPPIVELPVLLTDAATNITQTSATLNGTVTNFGNQTIISRGFEWKLTAGGTYTQVQESGTDSNMTYPLSGLTENTTYTYRAFVSTADTTIYGGEVQFVTLEEEQPDTCATPTDLQVNNISDVTAEISWTAMGDENSWLVEYLLQTGGEWQTQTVTEPYVILTGLAENSTYNVRVKAICDEMESEYATTSFTTSVGVDEVNGLVNSIVLKPNPADNHIELYINSLAKIENVEIYNAMGQHIQTVQLQNQYANINLENITAGMYFVRIYSDRTVVTKKFIKK